MQVYFSDFCRMQGIPLPQDPTSDAAATGVTAARESPAPGAETMAGQQELLQEHDHVLVPLPDEGLISIPSSAPTPAAGGKVMSANTSGMSQGNLRARGTAKAVVGAKGGAGAKA